MSATSSARCFVEATLKKLNQKKIDSAAVAVSTETGFSVEVRAGDVETLEHHLENNFLVTVYSQNRTGSATSTDFSDNAVDAAINKACSIAQFAHPDPCAGLPEENRLAKNYPDCALSHPWSMTPTEAIQTAIQCEKIALSVAPEIRQCEGILLGTLSEHYILANTLGFIGEYDASLHNFSCSMLASDKNQMQRDDEYTVARRYQDLTAFEWVVRRAAQKTVARLGARSIDTQCCPVIFEAPVAKSLLHAFVQAISGSNVYRHASFLCDRLGQAILPAWIDVFQEPHLLHAMGSAPFDSEGVATQDLHYVKQGELIHYVLGTYSARKLKLLSTGNAGGVYNLSITHSEESLADLMKKMHRGLLVTEMMGQGVNITTGDYSRGIAGFWIDHGEIQFPVEGVTIAGNLKEMLSGIVAIAHDIDMRSTIRTGSILIDSMVIAS